MRFNLLVLFVFVTLILGCGLSSAIKQKKDELCIHCYSCDSLGVEKTVFARYEPIYFGCIIKNVSDRHIKYKYFGDRSSFFVVSCSEDNGNIMPIALNWSPPEMQKESELKPGEVLSRIEYYNTHRFLPSGRCKASFSFNVELEDKNDLLFNRSNTAVIFSIE